MPPIIVMPGIAFILKGLRVIIMLHITIMLGIVPKNKDAESLQRLAIYCDLSLSVSRVLSCTVIYLGLLSPTSSSDVNGIPSDGQPY